VEFDFIRTLIENQHIPEDVRIQLLVQSREHLIARTIEALSGAHKPIVHLYNPTSENQRRIVFRKDKKEIIAIALEGVRWIKKYAGKSGLDVQLEYSPESFTGTEPEFALQICEAVINEWQPSATNKIIINLPSTVELSMPNIFADRIEWMSGKLKPKDSIILSVHTHNDRGTAVAAAELALLAGAQRIEGTLFGNGERTGNADIITIALNMYTQGVYPQLDFSNINDLKKIVESVNKIPVHERQPYVGELVYTAFSGSHQDAIKKGMEYRANKDESLWEVPYLPIDPADLGRSYEQIIRLNSQSGKGGTAFVLEKELGYCLPREIYSEVGVLMQSIADQTGVEVSSEKMVAAFKKEYLEADGPLTLKNVKIDTTPAGTVQCILSIGFNSTDKEISGLGNGPLDACHSALKTIRGLGDFNIGFYSEHALTSGSGSQAIAYVRIEKPDNDKGYFGVGIDVSITLAAIKALVCALNRYLKTV
ncbi:MAG: 2-isopropylmalate synthase, partial [Candidatus Margulisbacteria bacterium]|nr:2-isopropylmalate synthase [Candidatus Margulisiibacteriota bacterium]